MEGSRGGCGSYSGFSSSVRLLMSLHCCKTVREMRKVLGGGVAPPTLGFGIEEEEVLHH